MVDNPIRLVVLSAAVERKDIAREINCWRLVSWSLYIVGLGGASRHRLADRYSSS